MKLHSADRSTTGRRGFTLVEMLAVLLIVAILAALVVGGGGYARRKAREGRAVSDLERMKHALTEYQLDRGALPSNIDMAGFAAWLPEGFSTNDPWGHAYVYVKDGAEAFRVFSLGPDGASGSAQTDADNIEP